MNVGGMGRAIGEMGAVLEGVSVPPSGYVFLRGQNANGSYSVLRGLISPGVYVNLAGK
jgi:hypothetical protein